MTAYFPRGHIVIFAKAPQPGRVKTRLSPALGRAGAAELALAGLLDTQRVAATIAPVTLCWDGDPSELPTFALAPKLRAQSQGDLGQRMGDAFAASLQSGSAWALALGTDSPGLPVSALVQACSWLDRASTPRAVLGPTDDGGYYLLGVSAWQHDLLRDLPWSQPTTRRETQRRLESRGYECTEVAPYFDVDVAEDLARLKQAWRAGQLDAPATVAWLERWFSDPLA